MATVAGSNGSSLLNPGEAGDIQAAAGSAGMVQYNSADLLAGDSGLIYSGGILSVTNNVVSKNLTAFNNSAFSTSLVTPCTMSVNANPAKFDIPAFTGRVVDSYTDPLAPVVTTVAYAGSTANVVTNLATADASFICIDASSVIHQTTTLPTAVQRRDWIVIGNIRHPTRTAISSILEFTLNTVYDAPASLTDMAQSLGPINTSGNIYSGNAASGLKVDRSSGTTCLLNAGWSLSKKSPNVVIDAADPATTFYLSRRDGSGGFTTSVTDTIIPGSYDAGTVSIGVLGATEWQLFRLYKVPGNFLTVIEYGQVKYSSLAAAAAARSTATVQNSATSGLGFRGWIAVRGGATDLKLASDALFMDAGMLSQPGLTSGTGLTTATLQDVYNNSASPEITTTTTIGSVDLKRGSAADTDSVFRVLNAAGTPTATVTGAGTVSAVGVGVGTAAPSSSLDVLGTTRLGDHATNYTLVGATGNISQVGTASTFKRYVDTAVDLVLSAAHDIVTVSVAGKNVTLPTAAGIAGRQYVVDNISTGTVTLLPNGVETIQGETSQPMPPDSSITVYSTGTIWRII